jgi:hypothetical protein
MDNEILLLPTGLKNFVDKALDLLDIKSFFPNFAKNGGNLNGVAGWMELIRCFLKLEIEFDNTLVPEKYKKVKYVMDLPEEDIKKCLLYMEYQLGMTPHTGGLNFYELYIKIK